jgi:TonB family protein
VTSRGEEACADLGELTPYVEAVKEKVRRNWYHLAPNTARLPERKQGSVTVEFSILRNGGIANDRVIVNSGEADLDAAALSAVKQANPFAQLPDTFRADHLQLRFHFQYNPSDTVIKAN